MNLTIEALRKYLEDNNITKYRLVENWNDLSLILVFPSSFENKREELLNILKRDIIPVGIMFDIFLSDKFEGNRM